MESLVQKSDLAAGISGVWLGFRYSNAHGSSMNRLVHCTIDSVTELRLPVGRNPSTR